MEVKMKTGFRNSSTFIAYSFLSVAFGASFCISIVWVGILFWVIVTGTEMPAWYSLTVKLNAVLVNPSSNRFATGFTLGDVYGNLVVLHPTRFISFLSNLIPVMLYGSICYGIFLLRKIIKNVDNGNHFAYKNVKHTRIIGWLIMLVPHIVILTKNVIFNIIPNKTIINGLQIERTVNGPIQIFNFALLPEIIFAGLLVFIFAEVFKAGKTLKEENDLTV
jgi:hypothetical protein